MANEVVDGSNKIVRKVNLAKPMITQEDIDGVVAVLKSGWLSLGPKITEFENNFACFDTTR